MDKWQEMKEEIDKHYKNIGEHKEWSPFVTGNDVVAAVEDENGKIWTGVNIETACGVVCVCAERVALLKMVTESNTVVVRRIMCFDEQMPTKELVNWAPCGACREFLMQLSDKNAECEILVDWNSRETIKLKDLIPFWWGDERYKTPNGEQDK